MHPRFIYEYVGARVLPYRLFAEPLLLRDLGEHISAGLHGEYSAMLLQDHGEPLVLQAIHGQIIARRYIYVDSNGVIRTTGLLVRKKAYINLRLLPGYWFGNA